MNIDLSITEDVIILVRVIYVLSSYTYSIHMMNIILTLVQRPVIIR